MSTLKQKAQDILDEKEEKIIPENIKKDIQIFDVTGTLEEGIDTSDATATENDLVEDTTAYVNGVKIEGTLYDERHESGYYSFENIGITDNPGAEHLETEGEIILPNGYTGVVFNNNIKIGYEIPYNEISSAIELDSNVIVQGHTVLDVEGTYEGIDTSDATATENDIVENTSAYVDGVKLDGTLIDSREQSTVPYIGSAHYGTDYGTTSTVSFMLPQNTPDMVVSSENEFLGYINNANFAYSIGLTADILKKNENVLGVIGTLEGGTDTSDANATANDLVENTTAYVNGVKLEGAIGDYRSDNLNIIPESASVISHTSLNVVGHLDLPCASSSVAINNGTSIYMEEIDLTDSEITDEIGLVPEVIKKGETILGITGTLDVSGIDTSDATATANDLVMNTTAYVKGTKISGSIRDYRSESGIADFEDLEYSGEEPLQGKLKLLTHMESSSPDTVISSDNNVELEIPYYELTSNIGLTANKLKRGETILGITGTLDTQGTDTSDATASADDIVNDKSAYVDGEKIVGLITDRRDSQDIISLTVTQLEDNSGTEMYIDVSPIFDTPDTTAYAINENSVLNTVVQYEDIVSELGITSDMIKEGEEILGVTGTYSGPSIVYLEPGDEIHINMIALQTALLNATDAETRTQTLAYDGENEDLFTVKLMDCVNLGQPYEHSGMGLVMNGATTYLKIYNWDSSTDTNTLQSSDFIELVSGNYPIESEFTISGLISLMSNLGGYNPTDLVFTYPSNAPIIPLIKDNIVKLLTKEGCDIGDVLTFNLANSYITIEKGSNGSSEGILDPIGD